MKLLHSSEEIPQRRLIDIIKGTAQGLRHLHQQGVIHRDLAARNILVRNEPDSVHSFLLPSSCRR